MTGIKDLGTLLSSINPVLDERSFVFCTFPEFHWDDVHQLNPIGFFHEKEGLTLIITQQEAIDKNIDYESVYKLISLNVHSSLDAVGLTCQLHFQLNWQKRILVPMWLPRTTMITFLCLKKKQSKL